MTIFVEIRLSGRTVSGIQPRADVIILLDDGDSHILYDIGPVDAFLSNAALLNEPLTNLNTVVLSPCHYDHSVGVTYLSPDTRLLGEGLYEHDMAPFLRINKKTRFTHQSNMMRKIVIRSLTDHYALRYAIYNCQLLFLPDSRKNITEGVAA